MKKLTPIQLEVEKLRNEGKTIPDIVKIFKDRGYVTNKNTSFRRAYIYNLIAVVNRYRRMNASASKEPKRKAELVLLPQRKSSKMIAVIGDYSDIEKILNRWAV